jgi:hypothetical protein
MRPKSSKQKHKQPSSSGNGSQPPDELVVDRQARKECGNVCRMTFNRWEKDLELQLPPAIRINNRKYRLRSQLEKFKEQLKALKS